MNLLNDEKDGMMIRWRDYNKCVSNAKLDDFIKLNFRKRERLVDIVSYCLMSNHYHLILKQKKERGIERFLQKLGTSYTKYFNEKYKRNGALFQGRFRSSHVFSDGNLMRMIVYVSCNSEVHKVKSANNYKWCSFLNHIEKRKDDNINDSIFLEHFRDSVELENYARETIMDFQGLKKDQQIFHES